MKINVELVTPEELVFSEDVESVVVPGSEGDFGVLYKHAPMISSIRPGVVTLENEGTVRKVFIAGGIAEVTGERCTILAEESKDVTDLSESQIQKLIDKSELV